MVMQPHNNLGQFQTSLPSWLDRLMDQGILTTDRQLNIQSWNNWLEIHSGQSAASVIGRNLFEVYPELTRRRLNRFYEQALEGQVVVLSQRLHNYLLPLPLMAPTSLMPYMLQSTKIAPLFEAGECIGTITLIEDVTERVTRETELRHKIRQLEKTELELQAYTRELQRSLDFEATSKRISDKVRDSLDEAQILQTAVRELAEVLDMRGCNAALYDLEQGVSKICYEHIISVPSRLDTESHIADFPEIHQTLMAGNFVQFCSLIPNTDRGNTAVLACPIFDNAGTLGSLWLVSYPEHQFNEIQVRLAQQTANQCAIALRQANLYNTLQQQVTLLENLSQMKDDFLSSVSHELRTPLTNIKMSLQMLSIALQNLLKLTTIQTTDPAEQTLQKIERYSKIAEQECDREINLVNDLLILQHLEANTEPINLSPVNLTEWLTQITRSFQTCTDSKNQTLHLQITPNLPNIQSDSTFLQRILIELLNNAFKYSPPHADIVISTQITSTTVQIQVTNSGVELPAAEFSKIFDKFYRIPHADPWKHGGTGLGLALVKKLVAYLGGSISAESGEGQTCFIVELPLSQNSDCQ